MALPFPGGRVRFSDGNTRYPDGRSAWRCAACGLVSPWMAGWGGYWSLLQEDDGLYADHGRGYPIWCSALCQEKLVKLGECSEVAPPVTVERRRKTGHRPRSRPTPAPEVED